MYTRRRLLRECGCGIAAATGAAAAGCLSDEAEPARSYLAEIADTRPDVVSTFTSTWTSDPAALHDAIGRFDPVPELGRRLLSNVEENVAGASVEDVDRLTGQYGQVGGVPDGDVQIVRPSAGHVLATGGIDVAAVTDWLRPIDATEYLGADSGFERFGTDGSQREAFVVGDSHLGYGFRQGVETESGAIADAAIDALDDAAPVRELAPELAAVADAAGGETITAATQFDLVAERPDTGTPEYDAIAGSLLAAGTSATIDGEEAAVERLLQYRRDREPGVEAVETAFDRAASDDEPLSNADWSVRREDRTIVAEATVPLSDVRAAPDALRTAFPIPALEDVTRPIDPGALGRDPPPRVNWRPSQTDDGEVTIAHGGGTAVSDLVVAYTADGDRREESWSGAVESGDEFTTAAPPDAGTFLDLVWAQETPNETILLRIQLGE